MTTVIKLSDGSEWALVRIYNGCCGDEIGCKLCGNAALSVGQSKWLSAAPPFPSEQLVERVAKRYLVECAKESGEGLHGFTIDELWTTGMESDASGIKQMERVARAVIAELFGVK